MTPYRTSAAPLSRRWGATFWARAYARVWWPLLRVLFAVGCPGTKSAGKRLVGRLVRAEARWVRSLAEMNHATGVSPIPPCVRPEPMPLPQPPRPVES